MNGINRTEIALSILGVADRLFDDVQKSTVVEEALLDAGQLTGQKIAGVISSAELKIATNLHKTAKKIINSATSG